MIQIKVDSSRVEEALRQAQIAVSNLGAVMRQVSILAQRMVRERFTTGRDPNGLPWRPLYPRPENAGRRPLNKTGALAGSIEASSAPGKAFVGTNHPIAPIQHYGARTRPHVIEPRGSDILSWAELSGARAFRKRVNHPGSVIPARRFMALGAREETQVVEYVAAGIHGALRAKGFGGAR